MRVKIPRWEIAVICSALLFPGTSLSAQEVGQEEKEDYAGLEDVEPEFPEQDAPVQRDGADDDGEYPGIRL